MKRLLTGLQPSGVLTLGNYIGSIRQVVGYQDNYDSFIFIADMHSITVPQDPKDLSKKIKSLLALYLACGVDPNKNTIFLQSDNVYHANTSWILECLTPYGELSRMTQFKDKKQKNSNFSAGLLTYPVLMAADILLYDTDVVPVGQDQKQHVEITRNIAERVNKKYNKEIFKMPEPLIAKSGAKIMDLVDPTKKMSKSSDNPKGVIYMTDDENQIRKKIMGATTDYVSLIEAYIKNNEGITEDDIINYKNENFKENVIPSIDQTEFPKLGNLLMPIVSSAEDNSNSIQSKFNDLYNGNACEFLFPDLDESYKECIQFWNGIISKGMEQSLTQMSVALTSVLDDLKNINNKDISIKNITVFLDSKSYFREFQNFIEYYFYLAYLETAEMFNILRKDIVKNIKNKFDILLILYLIVSIFLFGIIFLFIYSIRSYFNSFLNFVAIFPLKFLIEDENLFRQTLRLNDSLFK